MNIVATTEKSGTLSQSAYLILREDILIGTLAPGSRVKIDALRKRYTIGPTPLREALSRLAADRFVIIEENRGFSIPSVSLEDLRDITDQRKLIECAALRSAIERADEEFEARVLAAYYRLSRAEERRESGDANAMKEWEVRHREYHMALTIGAKSKWLEQFQGILFDQADRYRRLYLRHSTKPRKVKGDHKQILDATLDRDADAACLHLERHIEGIFEIARDSSYFNDPDA